MLLELDAACTGPHSQAGERKGYPLPLIIAGDLFDIPKPSPGLIRFAWELLPDRVYAVAGQHDLPNHSLEELDESGLGLLVTGGRVTMLDHNPTKIQGGVQLFGVSWKRPVISGFSSMRSVAVIHRYCWKEGHSFPGCPPDDHIDMQTHELEKLGYTSACFGDNHKGFSYANWVNCGIAIPRNADFKEYVPHYYYLMSDGTFVAQAFETEHKWQPWVDEEETGEAAQNLLDFAKEVAKLVGSQTKENFLDELQEAMADLKDEGVRKKVWEVLQAAQESLK